MQMLKEHGHHPIPINPAFAEILGEKCYPAITDIPGLIDTITMYVGRERSDPIIDQIVASKPRRIIMNPGAENDDLGKKAREKGIEVLERCTLVMLGSGTF